MLFARKKRRIVNLLLVEDEPLVAFDNEHFLRDAGYAVIGTIDRVADALTIIDGEREIDLVLADVSLADGNGMDVARAAHGAGVPVMFVTGACPDGAREVAVGCLAKPYAQRDLLAAITAIEAMLDSKPPKRIPSGLSLFAPVE